jgi:hypothetical protein
MKILENLIYFDNWKILESVKAEPLEDKSLKIQLDSNTKTELMDGEKVKDQKAQAVKDLAVRLGKIKKEDLDKATLIYKREKNDKGEEELIVSVTPRMKKDEIGVISFEDLKKEIEKAPEKIELKEKNK